MNSHQRKIYFKICNLLSRPELDEIQRSELISICENSESNLPLPFLPPLVCVHDLFWHHLDSLDVEFDHVFSGVPKILKDRESRVVLFFQQKRSVTQLLEKTTNEKIKVMLIKGAALQDFYPSGFLRSASDYDFVIKPGHLSKLQKVLSQNGWRSSSNLNSPSWYHVESSAVIDLHLAEKKTAECIFEDSQPVLKENEFVTKPKLDDHLLITGLHNLNHPSKQVWRDLADIRALKLNGGDIKTALKRHRFSVPAYAEKWVLNFLSENTEDPESLFQLLGAIEFSMIYFEFFQPARYFKFLPKNISKRVIEFYRSKSNRKKIDNFDPFFPEQSAGFLGSRRNLNQNDFSPYDYERLTKVLEKYRSQKLRLKLFSPALCSKN